MRASDWNGGELSLFCTVCATGIGEKLVEDQSFKKLRQQRAK
jgi:hypothetical protein